MKSISISHSIDYNCKQSHIIMHIFKKKLSKYSLLNLRTSLCTFTFHLYSRYTKMKSVPNTSIFCIGGTSNGSFCPYNMHTTPFYFHYIRAVALPSFQKSFLQHHECVSEYILTKPSLLFGLLLGQT